jgi:hypothetical protein
MLDQILAERKSQSQLHYTLDVSIRANLIHGFHSYEPGGN